MSQTYTIDQTEFAGTSITTTANNPHTYNSGIVISLSDGAIVGEEGSFDNATGTFSMAPTAENKTITTISITASNYLPGMRMPSGWTMNYNTKTATWTGTGSSSVPFHFDDSSSITNITVTAIPMGISVDPGLKDKWFKYGETIKLTGTYASGGTPTITVGGNAAEVDSSTNTWSYTYTSHEDTKGENVKIVLSDGSSSIDTDYTLKIDTAAPELKLNFTDPQYKDEATGINWYKMDETAKTFNFSAVVLDVLSGPRSITQDGTEKGTAIVSEFNRNQEMANPFTSTFYATDVAGNTSENQTFKYDVDGSGPTIENVSFAGDSMKVVHDTVWFKKDDNTAVLNASINDVKSGLKKAKYNNIAYDVENKKFTISTAEEGRYDSKYIVAVDNVGNEEQSLSSYSYGVDGTAPTIRVTQDPDLPKYAGSVVVSALMDDGNGSGIKTQEYKINDGNYTAYTGDITITTADYVDEKCIITFKAVDNVGYETTREYQVVNVDLWNPEITLSYDNTTKTVSAFAQDEHTKVTTWYKFGEEGTWVAYTDPITVEADGTYYFRALDEANNSAEASVIFKNYDDDDASEVIIVGKMEMVGWQKHNVVSIKADSTLTQNSILLQTEELTFEGNSSTLVGTGSTRANRLNVYGNDNELNGNCIVVKEVYLANGADIKFNKDQFDIIMNNAEFVEGSQGKLYVTAVVGNSLTQATVKSILAKDNLYAVAFDQDLININKLTFNTAKSMNLDFKDAYGTAKSDTITFKKGSDVVLGSEGYYLDLLEGNNTVQVEKESSVAINTALYNISTLKTAAKSDSFSVGNVVFQSGRDANLKAEGATFKAGQITGSDKTSTITIGKNSQFTSGSINLSSSKVAYLNANKGSIAVIGSIENTDDTFATFQGDVINFSGGNDRLNANGAVFATGIVSFSAGNDKLTTAAGSQFYAATTWEFANGDMTYGKGEGAELYFSSGNDTLSIGKESFFFAGDIDSADTVTVGAYSEVTVGSVSGTKNFTLNSGSAKLGGTFFNAKDITGTAKNDNFSVGNYNTVILESLSFGEGSDTLSIGKESYVNVSGKTDFGSVKTRVSVGANSEVVLKAEEAEALASFSIGKDSKVYLSSEIIEKCEGFKNFGKNAQVYDIGTFDVAANFTDAEAELLDNTVEDAMALYSGDYNGWLNDELDAMDFMVNESAAGLVVNFGEAYTNIEFSTDGSWESLTEASFFLAADVTVGFRVKEDAEGSFKYSVTALDI